MTMNNEDEILDNENAEDTEHRLETERMMSALSRMTDEDMQNIFDRAFADFQESMLNPNRNQSE